jgi:FkbM family methyltransferase
MHRLRQKIKSVYGASIMGTNFHDRLTVAITLLWRPLRRRFGQADSPCAFRITINHTPLTVTLDGSHEEFLIFDEIMVRQEYAVSAEVEGVKTIIDAGANIGLVSLYYSAMYPDATIYAFEPNPELFPRLLAQVAQCTRIVPSEVALGGATSTVTFYVNPKKSIASSLVMREDMDLVPYEVSVTTLDEAMHLAQVAQIDILQFDVEGAEYDMLAGSTLASESRVLIGEIHEDLSGHPLADFLALFPRHRTAVAPGHKAGRYVLRAQLSQS